MNDPITTILNQFLHPLQWYMQQSGGMALIASDALHAWAWTQNNENTAKAILFYAGDELRGTYPLAAIERISRVDMCCVVSRNRGLGEDRGASLINSVGNAKPLFCVVGEIREIIRCFTYDGAIEMPVDYKSTTLWQTGPYISDAYCINFSVPVLLPAVSVLNQQT